jgi:MFS family permease
MILLGVRLQAFTWPFLVLLPLLFPEQAVPLFLACAVVYYASGALVSPHWSSLMGDLVPARKRGRFFALRNRLASITSFVALISGGMVLNLFDEAGLAYAGFMTVFSAAAIGRLVSAWHLARMHDPEQAPAVPSKPISVSLWQRVRCSRLARFSLFFSSMQFAVAVGSPFFAVYVLRDLHFSYLQFAAVTAASVLMQFLSLSMWGRLGDRFGHRFVLVTTGFVVPFVPALWLISDQMTHLLMVQAFSGTMWAGFSLSAGNFLYDLVPAPKRVTLMAYHNVLANSGIFAGALLGGWLATHIPTDFQVAAYELHLPSVFLGVFFVSFLIRIVVAGLFLPRLHEVRPVRPIALGPVLAAGLLPVIVPIRGMVYEFMERLRAIAMFVR